MPLWDPPSGLDPMGRVELQGHFVRGLARRIRDPRTPRHVRFALRVVTAVLFLSFVVPLTLVVVDIVLRF